MTDNKPLLTPQTMKVGGKYNWRNQPDRLVYLGRGPGRQACWHQFALVEKPEIVWCEVLGEDLRMIEETPDADRAMRAAAPGLKDHEVAALVNRLRDVAIRFHDSQQLRERIAALIRPLSRSLEAQAAPAAVAGPSERTELANQIKKCAEHWAYMERIDHGDQARAEQSRHAEMVDRLAVDAGPNWEALHHAWMKIGADVAGLDWGAFTNAVHYAPTTQPAPQPANTEIIQALRALHDSVERAMKRGALSERALEIIIMQPATDVLMRLDASATQPPEAAPSRDALRFPDMTPELASILGTMCFQCIPFAQALRAAGHPIETRAEDEQAAVLHWMLSHFFRHGEGWREHAVADMGRMRDAAHAQQEGK